MKIAVAVAMLGLATCACAQTSLASLRFYERFRDTLFNVFRTKTSNSTKHMERALMLQVLSGPFPCETAGTRSPVRPQSVHRLRPGDIDVIGAMGDSITAAYGTTALNPLQVLVPNRGTSWSGGGESTWREFVTLPNILKEFNPNLVGYSYNDSLAHHRASQFNVAEGAAMSSDMLFQAKLLLRRMRVDPRVDLQNDWKLITLFLASNDFCFEMCYTDSKSLPEKHRVDLTKAFDFLQENVPRTLVNLVPTPRVELFLNLTGKSTSCDIISDLLCPCIYGSRFEHRIHEFIGIMDRWRDVQKEVADSERYKTTDDFAVVLQPFSKEFKLPMVDSAQGRIIDYSYLSQDCFHFSQKANAVVSNALWNNMLEPVGNKSLGWQELFTRFLCPSEKTPYIFTAGNSHL